MSGRGASRGPAARVERLEFEAGGVRLSVADFGGTGQAVVLLHGLAGHGEEWVDTAGPLAATHRVIAPDARGHGFSEGNPPDVSAAAHVADAAAAIDELHLGPAVLVGQSLGGLTALALAAEHPEMVAALVVVEAGPEAADDGDLEAAAAWLASWPVPFSDRTAAERFFGGSQLRAQPLGGWAADEPGRPAATVRSGGLDRDQPSDRGSLVTGGSGACSIARRSSSPLSTDMCRPRSWSAWPSPTRKRTSCRSMRPATTCIWTRPMLCCGCSSTFCSRARWLIPRARTHGWRLDTLRRIATVHLARANRHGPRHPIAPGSVPGAPAGTIPWNHPSRRRRAASARPASCGSSRRGARSRRPRRTSRRHARPGRSRRRSAGRCPW